MRLSSSVLFPITLGLVTAAAACGGEDTTGASSNTSANGAAGPGGNGVGGMTASSTGAGGASACPAPGPAHEGPLATDMDGATAMLIDQNGQPAAGVACTVCGQNVCSQIATSGANGAVTVPVAPTTPPYDHPRFNTGHTPGEYAKLTGKFTMMPTQDFGTVRVIRIPAFSQGAMLTPGQDATNSNVTLGIPAGAVVDFEFDFVDVMNQRFVAAVVDITAFNASELPQVPAALAIEVLVATGPFGTHICPAAKLTFPNVAGWPANAEVELYLNGNLTFAHYAPYGGWALLSEGVVSTDGMTVTTKDGMGVEMLGVFGVSLK